MTDMKQAAGRPDPLEVVAAALSALGEATAAAVADKAGMAYSTVTPKLRALEKAGRAAPVRAGGRTLWRPSAPDTTARAAGGLRAGASDGDQPTTADPAPQGPDDDHDDTRPAEQRPGEPQTRAEAPDVDPPQDRPGPDTAVTALSDGIAADSRPTNDDDRSAADEEQAGDGTDPADARQPEPAADEPGGEPRRAAAKPRRRKGRLRQEVLDVLRAKPDTAFGPHEVAKAIPDASEGAIRNALDKLTEDGSAALVQDKPARFRAE